MIQFILDDTISVLAFIKTAAGLMVNHANILTIVQFGLPLLDL